MNIDGLALAEEVVTALNARDWPEYVHRKHGERIGDTVAPTLRPVVGAAVEPDQAVRLGGSKIGGLPHVDSSFVWPTEDGTDEPLALVCQFNLDEAKGLIPAGGMLYLFSIYDSDRAYGYEIYDETAKILHVPTPGPLAVAERPAGLDDEGVLSERALRIGPSLDTEEFDDEEGIFVHARFDYEVEKAIELALVEAGGVPCDIVQLLGRIRVFRDETRELVDQSTQELLLYVNGYAVDRHAFGEGEFRIVIDKTALAAGQLDRAEILFEPGT